MKNNSFESLQSVHRESVDAFVAAARSISPDRWSQPIGQGQWTPGQVSEHVRLAYGLLANELSGGQGLRIRTGFWTRLFIRIKYLPKILKTGKIPASRAPRELRPPEVTPDREKALLDLKAEVDRFENQLLARWNDPKATVSHHFFGKFSAREAFQFVTIHTRHHLKQLQGVGKTADG